MIGRELVDKLNKMKTEADCVEQFLLQTAFLLYRNDKEGMDGC